MNAAGTTLVPDARATGPAGLLADLGDGGVTPLATHRRRYPAPPPAGPAPRADLISVVADSGLGGRGGAGFPTGEKLRAVAARRGPRVVVVNASEGEPASAKDRLLLTRAPHLVLDGAVLAAAAVGAETVVVAVDRAHTAALDAVRQAIVERRGERATVDLRLAATPTRYVAGESSALVRWLDGGPAKPTGASAHAGAPGGVEGRPTLVQNVETLAHLAQILRYGSGWFRATGTADEPGTALVTVTGAVRRPCVMEVPWGTPVSDLLGRAGGPTEQLQALLVGGFSGAWVPAPAAFDAPFSRAGLAPFAASPGAGVIVALPEAACGLTETARVLDWFAAESAGQCGPCVRGLPALAGAAAALPRDSSGDAAARLRRWADDIEGRGGCRHPDGAVALLRSALDVFAADLARHARGDGCAGAGRPPVLAVPVPAAGWR
ncbi:MAG TPA: NADH-ubiquinone oxidoreductase-F iron-sulfur binding region domain-containing protein [Acidimicrobiales bacterium]|nr:NADH-ubiquinone oxidoreductase-F iron-sulfur binding region domain-containing protein [Acidimicrobiales bacterium]